MGDCNGGGFTGEGKRVLWKRKKCLNAKDQEDVREDSQVENLRRSGKHKKEVETKKKTGKKKKLAWEATGE